MSLRREIDGDFDNIVPPHLRNGRIDIYLINEILKYGGNTEIFERLYGAMDSETEDAFHGTLEWHLTIERRERYARDMNDIRAELEQCRALMSEIFPEGVGARINKEYATYLINHGLPGSKINWWRKFLLCMDANIAGLSGRQEIAGRPMIDDIEPRSPGFYSKVAYPIRKVIRRWMLKDSRM